MASLNRGACQLVTGVPLAQYTAVASELEDCKEQLTEQLQVLGETRKQWDADREAAAAEVWHSLVGRGI